MLTQILDFFRRLFRVQPMTTNEQQAENTIYVARYEDVSDLNVIAMVAGRLSNLVCSDATITVEGQNDRAEYLNTALQRVVNDLKRITARALGVGGVVLKPYTYNGEVYTDIIPQNRYFVVEQVGDVVTRAGFIAEVMKVGDNTYTRTEYHSLGQGGLYHIQMKATRDEKEVPLSSVPGWEHHKEDVFIRNVERMLFAFVKCPVDNRKQFSDEYGVPITYGQDKLICEIVELQNEFQREYSNKAAFIGISDLLYKSNNELPKDGVYKKFRSDTDDFFEVFSPDIRSQAYIDGLNYKMELLEKAIGVNKGVLTNMETVDATATAIRRSTYDTFSLVDSMRQTLERAIDQLVYAFGVVVNAAALAPQGEYEITYDWSYALIEDDAEAWRQRMELVSAGGAGPEILRMWLLDETEEDALRALPDTVELLQ